MSLKDYEQASCSVLIIGSGIAGLLLAEELAARNLPVIIACKEKLADSNTSRAQGGLAAVAAGAEGTDKNNRQNTDNGGSTQANSYLDSYILHRQDTLAAGAGLCHEDTVADIIGGGQILVKKLVKLGVSFDRRGLDFDRALEGGHSSPRVLHSRDASGKAITQALIERVQANNLIEVAEGTFALDLLVNDTVCQGAVFLQNGRRLNIWAANTVLATGGIGQVFSRTTNPEIATGDGIAMAYRSGARLVDMEFVQFHPTALCLQGAPALLISEAARGAGAHLLDHNGQRFAFNFHKDGELATRDVVARAIHTTMEEHQLPCVFLDMRPVSSSGGQEKFPNIFQACHELGLNPADQPLPVSPAAHYFMGGIAADAFGRTSLNNLFAIGECASTGLHGANRLASNSLLEGGVMALNLADWLCDQANADKHLRPCLLPAATVHAPYPVPTDLADFRRQMFRLAGLTRTKSGLITLLDNLSRSCQFRVPEDRAQAEAANLALIGYLIAQAALIREESRGAHYRADYPKIDDRRFQQRYYMSRAGDGWFNLAGPSTGILSRGYPLTELPLAAL